MEPQQIQPQTTNEPTVPTTPMPEQTPDMNTMPPQKSGKGWMIIAIIAIILLILIGVLYYASYSSAQSSKSSLNAQVTDLQGQVNTLKSAADSTNIFKITEFSSQFSKPADAKDAFYFVNKNAEGNQVAYFSSPALQVLAAANPSTPAVKNACGLNDAPLGTITQVKAGTVIKGVKVEEVKNTDLLIVKKQDVNYLVYNAPAAQCSTVKSVQELQAKQAKSFQETFNNNLAALSQ